jgi:hypothetical protein
MFEIVVVLQARRYPWSNFISRFVNKFIFKHLNVVSSIDDRPKRIEPDGLLALNTLMLFHVVRVSPCVERFCSPMNDEPYS